MSNQYNTMTDLQQSFPWLKESCSQLGQYIAQNRIPQALLIIGKQGLGKLQLAQYFAQSLLCTESTPNVAYCGTCQSCVLFNAQTHPDYIFIAPEEDGKAIGIGIIRQLTVKLALKPQFESQRVVIISPADSLNNASANAFLKYLEEPTERTSIILVSDKPSKLPATIRSRCQKIIIATPDKVLVKDWLQQQGISESIDLLLSLSQGSPLLAQQFSDNSVLQLRNEYFNDWVKLVTANGSFVELAEKWQKLDKNRIDLVLFWLISWVMDMIKLRHLKTVEIVNVDLITDLQELSTKLELKGLYQYYDFLLLSRQRIDTQLNKQLMFEEILIQWLQLNSR